MTRGEWMAKIVDLAKLANTDQELRDARKALARELNYRKEERKREREEWRY